MIVFDLEECRVVMIVMQHPRLRVGTVGRTVACPARSADTARAFRPSPAAFRLPSLGSGIRPAF